MLANDALESCPLCQAALSTSAYRPIPGYEKDHLVRCRACGFIFSLLDPLPEDYQRVYGAYDYEREDSLRTPLNTEKERSTVNRLLAYRSSGKVLDIAAGAGRFLEHFQSAGFDCYATEFSLPMCDYLTQKGFTAYSGGLLPDCVPANTFDVVIFTEIIEHINTPIATLTAIRDLLRPGGAVYITTPNFASLERRVIGPNWGMLMWPEHITYWTSQHIDRALGMAGFGKASLQTMNVSPYRIVQALKRGRMAKALRGVSEQAVSDAAQKTVGASPMLSMAKAAVNKGLRLSNLGSSIEAIYEKA